jgi:phosphoribosyl-ATP pyrophosphohydrolase
MGYHKSNIDKGVYGQFSKVKEEYEELLDAKDQGDKILTILEICDLYGALEGYANTLGYSIQDVIKFSNLTKEAFRDGSRIDKKIE